MVSAGLLLMSSTLYISMVTSSTLANQKKLGEISYQHLQKRITNNDKQEIIKDLKTLAGIVQNALQNIVPVVALLGNTPAGFISTSILGLVMFGLSFANNNQQLDMNNVRNEFKKLESTISKYHKEQKWDTWSASAYHKPEKDLLLAWDKFTTMILSVHETTNAEKKRNLIKDFTDAYKQHFENGFSELHFYITAKGVFFAEKFGDLLSEHLKCHEKDIKTFSDIMNTLMYLGYSMQQFYNAVMDIESDIKVDVQFDKVYDVYSTLSQIHRDCVSRSMVYVQKDVQETISKHTADDRQKLADEVYSDLKEKYDEYDWIVVAYKTPKFDSLKNTILSKHSLAGFTHVPQEPGKEVTVSVARQVKGSNNIIKQITDAIDSCLGGNVLCCQVPEKLRKCASRIDLGKGPWGHIPLTHTYTAVHAFTKKDHQCYETAEASAVKGVDSSGKQIVETEEEPKSTPQIQSPYVYSGSCKKSRSVPGGKFFVMIKSEKEIRTKDPCNLLDCGEGECIRITGVFRAMCKCDYPYFGEKCEKSVEDDKKKLVATKPGDILNTS